MKLSVRRVVLVMAGFLLVIALKILVVDGRRNLAGHAQDGIATKSLVEDDVQTRTNVSDLRRQIGVLSGELTKMRVELSQTVPGAQGTTPPADAAAPAARIRRLSPSPEEQARRRTYMFWVDSSFRSEPVDDRWAAAKTADLTDAFGKAGIAVDPAAIECRSQVCRMKLEENKRGELSDAILDAVSRLGVSLPSMQADYPSDGADSNSVVLYLAAKQDQFLRGEK